MKRLLTVTLLFLSACAVWADTRIHFAPGKSSSKTHAAVVRGTVEKFWVGAGKGQQMKVHVSSLENNAVFRVARRDGTALSKDEQTSWSGKLPAKGDYLIEVSGTRGNATFDLEVEIR